MAAEVTLIGAHAGAAAVLEEVLAALPLDFPTPVVVAHHRSQGPELLQRLWARSALPVREPDDKDGLQPGRVYLAPEGYHLLLGAAGVVLSREPAEHGFRPAIDPLFESASELFGSRALGILLSFDGLDGTRGVRALRQGGAPVLAVSVGRTISNDSRSLGGEIRDWVMKCFMPLEARVGT